MKHQRRLVIAICSVLFIGFALSSYVSYHLADKTFREQIRQQSLPLTSDNIYSHIQHDLIRPVLVSSFMANDTFVIDWATKGEQDPEKMIDYLSNILEEYDAVTAFYASNLTRNYYHPTGILKTISEDDELDSWYYDMLDIDPVYEINLDKDTADTRRTTFFVNHKIFDSEGKLLGIIGVGLSSSKAQTLIDHYQESFGRTVYFIDKDGNVKLHGTNFTHPLSVSATTGLNESLSELVSDKENSLLYNNGENDVYVSTRLIEPLDWYIVVEEAVTPKDNIVQALWFNLLISAIITLLIGWVITFNLSRFQQRLNLLATKDHLTQLASRQGFEPTFHQMLETARRNRQPLCILLVDIDHFKRINDNFGHLQGDNVLKQVARILDDNVRHCDAISRWGGEEFILALAECEINAANAVAEKIRKAITQQVRIGGDAEALITTSVGVAEFNLSESADELFSRADKALYRAKNAGRNRVALDM